VFDEDIIKILESEESKVYCKEEIEIQPLLIKEEKEQNDYSGYLSW